MLRPLPVLVAFALLITPSFAHQSDQPLRDIQFDKIWDQYNDATHRACPSHHIEDFTDAEYDTVLDHFLEKYPEGARKRIAKIVDYPKTCARETAGFSCEFSAHLAAFKQFGLFDKFVSYSCRHWRCEEAAICDELKEPN
jgi:hypothetical protein